MMENTSDVNHASFSRGGARVMILAGDIGGTKTLLGLFDPRTARPHAVHVRAFQTSAFPGLTEMIREFTSDEEVRNAAISAACFGVAGPVLGSTAELTNVPFAIDAFAVSRTFAIPQVKLLNDLEAMAYAVRVLEGDELHVLQQGEAIRGGNMALIAAGTGLGQALLHNVGGRFVPSPTEAGHADWAARTERDIARPAPPDRAQRAGRSRGCGVRPRTAEPAPCHAFEGRATPASISDDPDAPAALTTAALERRCSELRRQRWKSSSRRTGPKQETRRFDRWRPAGVFIGGGIAPKILPALTDGRFLKALRDKGAMRGLVEHVPVKIILNADAGLLGAAVHAADLAG